MWFRQPEVIIYFLMSRVHSLPVLRLSRAIQDLKEKFLNIVTIKSNYKHK